MTAPTPSFFRSAQGYRLAQYDWPLAPAQARAQLLLVHGLGEHAGRHDALARQLNAWGLAVRGYDHYGHGQSDGPRGALQHAGQLTADLAQLLQATRAQLPPGQPLLLLGHSMGGLVAADLVACGLQPVDGLVLSSPALAAFLSPLQKLLLACLPGLLPNLRVGNGLDANDLSHDPAVAAAYRADPLCHDRISARLARYIAQGGQGVLAAAPRWPVPTLLLWGEADRIINPAGCRALAAAAPAQQLAAQGFAGLYHEIFNELQADSVLQRLQAWLQEEKWRLPRV